MLDLFLVFWEVSAIKMSIRQKIGTILHSVLRAYLGFVQFLDSDNEKMFRFGHNDFSKLF